MFIAVERSDIERVNLLIKAGADVNASTIYGDTILHQAAGSGFYEAVKILLENGADSKAVNKAGKTPYDIARNDAVKELLEQHDKSNGGK
jgi:ankyrin repeat protein